MTDLLLLARFVLLAALVATVSIVWLASSGHWGSKP
jgi:hypothetical protein